MSGDFYRPESLTYGSVQYGSPPDPQDPMLISNNLGRPASAYGEIPLQSTPSTSLSSRPQPQQATNSAKSFARDPAAGYRRRKEMTALIGNQRHMEWNDKYQLLMESVPSGFVQSSEEFNRARSFVQDLLVLTKDFVNLAAMYGKIIISEKEMSVEDKTIKPVALGGAGSGTKYLQRGVLFKFPQVDEYGIYQGDDDWAAKAGGHELKGLMGFKSAGIKDLHLPLMALIDYRGYRLIAVSSVPISRDTLVYGSRDGGHSVVNKDPRAAELMENFGKFMLLKPLKSNSGSEDTYGPADIEVHKGLDGRYYVVDFSRVFPPEEPAAPGEQLIYQLRPEFVRQWPKPLSSDAYSTMISDEQVARECEAEIQEATNFLHESIIPKFVSGFQEYLRSGGADNFASATSASTLIKETSFSEHVFSKAQTSLITEMHRAGINIRHLGKLNNHATIKELKTAILVEMVARVMKMNLKRRWRSHTVKYPSAEDESYKRVTVRYLNQVLGRSDKTSLYWTFEILPQVSAKFEDAMTAAEQSELGRNVASDCFLKLEIAKRLEDLCGIQYSTKLEDKFDTDPEWFLQDEPIPELHVVRIDPVIKTTNTIPFMEGLLLFHSRGLESAKVDAAKSAADRFWVLKGAGNKFKEALLSVPGGRAEILALASVRYERAAVGSLPIDMSVRFLDSAQHTLEYLLGVYPDDPKVIVLHADVVHLSGRMRNNATILRSAFVIYRNYVEKNPKDSHALFQCGKCLLRLYYLEGKSNETLTMVLKYAQRAVDLLAHSGDAWALLARAMAIKTANDPDPALFAVCDDAFSRTFLYLLEHQNSDVMYRWAQYVLYKAIAFDNLDLLLVGTMKLKAAVEKQIKPEYFTVIRSCIHTIREKLNDPDSGSRWTPSTVAMVTSWLKVLKQAMKELDQRSTVIPWDDIELISPLTDSEFHFRFKATWIDWNTDDRPSMNESRDSSEPGSPAPGLARSDSLRASSTIAKGSVSQSLVRRFREKKHQLRSVVVKLVAKNIAIAADKQRYMNELKIMQHFDNPPVQLLRFYGRTYNEDHEGLVTEYFQGLPALERLQNLASTSATLSPEQYKRLKWRFITSIAHQVALGLDYMHSQNVLWANVSSRHVLVDEKGAVRIIYFEESQIISMDDPLGDLSFQAEVINFGGLLWELASVQYRTESQRPGALPAGADWPDSYHTAIKMCHLTENDALGNVGEVAEQLALAMKEFQ